MGRSFQIGYDIGILSALFEKKSVFKYKNTDRFEVQWSYTNFMTEPYDKKMTEHFNYDYENHRREKKHSSTEI